jgi:glycosyltransferase involved in cell wall biosynthesis
MNTIGVAILCYEGFKDLVMSLTALKQNTHVLDKHVEFIVFDNSDQTEDIKTYVVTQHPDVVYYGTGQNTGCTRSRNIIYHEFLKRHPNAEYLVIIDQDIEVRPNWLVDMIAVAEQYEGCGIVAWPQAYRLKPQPVGGVVSEVASMCNLHTIQTLKAVEATWGGPFDERFFFHKFDSLICQRLNQLNYQTRLVMKYYRRGVKCALQAGGIVHHHPHQGVRRHPQYKQIIRQSKQLYANLQRREGWKNWYPAQSRSTLAKIKASPLRPTLPKTQESVRRNNKSVRQRVAELQERRHQLAAFAQQERCRRFAISAPRSSVSP